MFSSLVMLMLLSIFFDALINCLIYINNIYYALYLLYNIYNALYFMYINSEEYAFLNPSYVIPEFIMHTTLRRQACEEEIINRKTKLQAHVSGVIEGIQPIELKTFLNNMKLTIPRDIDDSLQLQLSSLQIPLSQIIQQNDDNNTIDSNNNNNNYNYNDDVSIESKNKKLKNKQKNIKKFKKTSTHNFNTTDTASLSIKADEILQIELETRRQQRLEIMQLIEQITHDFTIKRTMIIKDLYTKNNK